MGTGVEQFVYVHWHLARERWNGRKIALNGTGGPSKGGISTAPSVFDIAGVGGVRGVSGAV